MAKYCQEKFERESDGQEKTVCWRQDVHVHDASTIKTIERKLHDTYGGTWHVRANSYRSNQSTCPDGRNAVCWDELK